MTVRSRDCAACEMNVTVSIGTSATPNFLALKDTHTTIIKLNSYYKPVNYTNQYVHYHYSSSLQVMLGHTNKLPCAISDIFKDINISEKD